MFESAAAGKKRFEGARRPARAAALVTRARFKPKSVVPYAAFLRGFLMKDMLGNREYLFGLVPDLTSIWGEIKTGERMAWSDHSERHSVGWAHPKCTRGLMETASKGRRYSLPDVARNSLRKRVTGASIRRAKLACPMSCGRRFWHHHAIPDRWPRMTSDASR